MIVFEESSWINLFDRSGGSALFKNNSNITHDITSSIGLVAIEQLIHVQ